jgi:ribosomal protein S18 acetylase RimI-like enzyme
MPSDDAIVRPAAPRDARALAELLNLAGEGIPALLWAAGAEPGRSAIDVGVERAMRTGVNFCFENAVVAEVGSEIAGMLLGYPIDDNDPGDLSGVPAVVHPLVRLECRAAGSWYVNAVATRPQHRGRGIGRLLMHDAHRLAARSGRDVLSLIVAQRNESAVRLYRLLGYQAVAREPVVPHPALHLDGDWILMTRAVSGPADGVGPRPVDAA